MKQEEIQKIANKVEAVVNYLEVKYTVQTSLKNVISVATIICMVLFLCTFILSDLLSLKRGLNTVKTVRTVSGKNDRHPRQYFTTEEFLRTVRLNNKKEKEFNKKLDN
jgi:hypothetical protein